MAPSNTSVYNTEPSPFDPTNKPFAGGLDRMNSDPSSTLNANTWGSNDQSGWDKMGNILLTKATGIAGNVASQAAMNAINRRKRPKYGTGGLGGFGGR